MKQPEPPEPDDREWKPRKHDHLVEPFFQGEDLSRPEPRPAWWRRLLAWFFRRSG